MRVARLIVVGALVSGLSIVGAGPATPPPASAAKGPPGAKMLTPAALCPRGTLAYFQTAPLQTARESVDAFGSNALGMMYGMAAGGIDAFFASPTGQAVDLTRSLGIVVLPPAAPGQDPRPYFCVPETAPGALAKAVEAQKKAAAQTGEPLSGPPAGLMTSDIRSVDGGYALVGEKGTLTGFVSGGTAWPCALSGTAVLSVDLAAVQQAFKNEIDAGFASMQGRFQGVPVVQGGMDPARIGAFYVILLKSLMNQSSKIELAIDLSEKGSTIKTLLVPKRGTTVERFVMTQTPGVSKSALGALSAKDAWCMSEISCDFASCAKTLVSLTSRVMSALGTPMDPALKQSVGEILAAGAITATGTWRTTPGDAMEISNVYTCAQAGVASRGVDFFKRMTQGGVGGSVGKPKTVSAKCPVHCYEMTMGPTPGLPPEIAQMRQQMIETFYGKGALQTIAQSGSHVVQSMGPDSVKRVEEMVEKLASPAAGAPPAWYAKLMESIPSAAQGRGGLSLLGTLRFAGRMMQAMTGANPMAMLDKMALVDSGIGGYALSSKAGFEFGIVIPVETYGLSQQVMMPLAMAMQGGQGARGGYGGEEEGYPPQGE